MYAAFIIAVLPLLWITLNVSSFVTILIHELGHAVPALLFTKKPVTIYIGTFGDDTSPKYTFGRLNIHIRPKLSYLKNRGLTLYDLDISFSKQLIILICAPLAVIAVIILLSSLLYLDVSIYIIAFIAACLASAIINLLVNLFPKKIIAQNTDRLYYSDGYQLILLAENKTNFINITNACRFYDERSYDTALTYLAKVNDKYMDESIFKLLLSCNVELGYYDKAERLNERYKKQRWYKLISALDHNKLGYAAMQQRDLNRALTYLGRSIKLDAEKFASLNDRGFVNNALGNYQQAKEDLNKAIYLNHTSSAAYSSRAFSNLKLNRAGEALLDAEKALEIDDKNPYAYLAIGMYLLKKGEQPVAMASLKKAKQLDAEMLFIDEYLKPVKKSTTAAKPKTVKEKKAKKKPGDL